MEDSVDCCLADGHGNPEDLIFLHPCLFRHLFGGLFHPVHAVQRGFECISDPACLRSCQMVFPAMVPGHPRIYPHEPKSRKLGSPVILPIEGSLLAWKNNVKREDKIPTKNKR